jgi:hypothetical protein
MWMFVSGLGGSDIATMGERVRGVQWCVQPQSRAAASQHRSYPSRPETDQAEARVGANVQDRRRRPLEPPSPTGCSPGYPPRLSDQHAGARLAHVQRASALGLLCGEWEWEWEWEWGRAARGTRHAVRWRPSGQGGVLRYRPLAYRDTLAFAFVSVPVSVSSCFGSTRACSGMRIG